MRRKGIIKIFLYTFAINLADAAFFSSDSSNGSFFDIQRDQTSLINKTFDPVRIWQPNFSLATIFNSGNDSSIAHNTTSKFAIPVPTNFSNLAWTSTVEDWPIYLHNVSVENRNGTILLAPNVTQVISKDITKILSSLSSIYSNNSLKNGSYILNGTLSDILPLFRDTVDFLFVTEIIRGISSLINSLRSKESQAAIRPMIDLTSIINARNGIEAFTHLLLALRTYYTLEEVLDTELNCGENLMRLMTQLGGNVCRGVTGRLRAMYEIFTTGYTECRDGLDNPSALEPEWIESVEGLNSVIENVGPNFWGLRNFVQRMRRKLEEGL